MDTNLTRAEAHQRAGLLTVDSYRVRIDLTAAATAPTFTSTTTVRFSCRQPGATTWIDLVAESIESAELNGHALDLSGYSGARLALPGLAADNELVVRARCWFMTTGEGLHRSTDPADGALYLHTQFAAADARRVLACFDQPDLKATFAWEVVAPAGWQVVSNCSAPDPEPAGPGTVVWTFPASPLLPTYLAALCAGPFHVVRDQYAGPHGTYPLAVFVRASSAQHLDADEFLGITRNGLAHYESEFAVPYPFGKYDQVLVPELNFGAMENPGVVTWREEVALFRGRVTAADRDHRAMVVLHEMAHMWFGDLVTMRWWDDLWLNESFADWAGYRTAALTWPGSSAWTMFALSDKAWAYAQDEMPSTHPVAADVPDLESMYLNFDGITYAKGASVLKQLVAFVGLEAFLAGLNTYFAAHAWGNASLADLLGHLGRASGRDLATWASAWLEQPGVTTLRPRVSVDDQGRYARVVVEQCPAAHPEGITPLLRPHRVAVGAYRWVEAAGGRRLVRDLRIEVDVLGAEADVPELAGLPEADLLLVNDDDLTYAKLDLDATGLATARIGVGALVDPLARGLVWGALWERVRAAALPAQDLVGIASAGLASEEDPGILEVVLRWLRRAVARYVAPELAQQAGREVGALTARLLEDAEPGSDRQLALALAHIESAVSPEHLDRLDDILGGRADWPGVPLDERLRWAIVTTLAARGRLDEERIEAVLSAERTSSGEQAAAQARAAIPTERAKAAAWALAVDGQGIPSLVLQRLVAGFAHPGTPAELLAPYREAYFARIAEVYGSRSPAEAATLAEGLFPVVHEETAAGARRLLEDASLAPGLRRILAEGVADVERALACREASRLAAQEASGQG
jgi:aminopeptidase N